MPETETNTQSPADADWLRIQARQDRQNLRQWAVDRAIPLARPHDPASITVIAQLLVDFVEGVETIKAAD